MSMPASPWVVQFFLRVLQARRWIAGAFLLLAAAGTYGALRVPDDPSIEGLIVAGGPRPARHVRFRTLVSRGRAGAPHARIGRSLEPRGAARRRQTRTGTRQDS